MTQRNIKSLEELEFMPLGSWVRSQDRLYRKTMNEQDHLPCWVRSDPAMKLTSSYLWRLRVNLHVPSDLEILAEALK